ncbi:hypothetical protein Ahia01_000906600, partial [Argonauta hians]
ASGPDPDATTSSFGDEPTFLILDPDHPKMVRFQTALKNYLNKMIEKTKLELLQVTKPLNILKQDKEDLGVRLYGLQQDLANQQVRLEAEQDRCANLKQLCASEQKNVEQTKVTCQHVQA